MQQYPKRLIEVDLPIREISRHARREKSIRHGHISTLHIWWARRPLAACRAVICASLWPDPADELCPPAFREAVARILPAFAEEVRNDRKLAELSQVGWSRWNRLTKASWQADHVGSWADMRYALLDFIADFANWDSSTVPAFLEASRELTQAAHEALGGMPGTRPLLVDPFAGGGAIPLEALRVGVDAFASDLNPVAVLLNKVVLEYIPKYGQELADEVREWGQWIKEKAEHELAEFYPLDPDGATPIAYLWARTITCEGPGCGTEVPLMNSMWLAKRKKGSVALQMLPDAARKHIDFEIIVEQDKQWVRQSDPTVMIDKPNFAGTVRRGSVTCPVCGYATPVESVRAQLNARRGGATDARMVAVVTTRSGEKGRFYRMPVEQDLAAARAAAEELERRKAEHEGPLSLVPDEPYPDETGSGAISSSVLYGFKEWGDLYSPRQALTATTLVRLTREMGDSAINKLDSELAVAVRTILAITANRASDKLSSLARWDSSRENPQGTFGRQALPMIWDFDEVNPISGAGGDWDTALSWVVRVVENNAQAAAIRGHADAANAAAHPLPTDSVQLFITDPPYYDAIAYGDLSDFFYVWLRRSVGDLYPTLFSSPLVNKKDEIVHLSRRFPGPYPHKTQSYFEHGMTEALAEGWRLLDPNGIGVIVFAHKSTSGWEAMLQAMIDANWTITGSWPIDTEMGSRMNAMGTASLASSVHLVARPREDNDIGDWRDVLQELPARIHEWLPRLAKEGVVGADALFACLGPALEIYSRYARVERADGSEVFLGEYLEYVWAAVSREALKMVFSGAETTGFEPDARLTAMWLWTLNANADEEVKSNEKTVASTGYVLEYDAARKIAQGLGAHLEQLDNLVEIKGSTARLLPVAERTRALFGKEGVQDNRRQKRPSGPQQLSLLELLPEEEIAELGLADSTVSEVGETVLDRVHQAMLLFGAGQSEAMKRFLVADGIGRDERFWRLAQALSALYPPTTDEKRWVDGVLARKKGLGL